MSPAHSFELRSNIPNRATRVTVSVLFVFTLVVLAVGLLAIPGHPVHASSGGSLSIGSVTGQTTLSNCPAPGAHWTSYTVGGTTYYMNCVSATITGCTSTQDIGFTYGYLNPSGVTTTTVKGVITYFDGAGGTDPAAELAAVQMLQYYYQQGYEVVQVAWNSNWEAVRNPWPISSSPLGNIQNAACRPATFLNYVATAPASWNLYQAVAQANSNAGMCAQGFSFGSAAIAYSLAYYGAGSYLDNVELISGPPASDIEQGCQEPNTNLVTICPSGQWGCKLGTGGSSWSLSPTYVPGENVDIRNWTDDNSCANTSGSTSSSSQTAWLNQSIVDQSTGGTGQGAVPTFTYSTTAMAAWLCRSVVSNGINCTTNYHYQDCPNNTSPQGQLFYQNITSSNSPPVYNVYAVDQCVGAEGAPQGTVLALGSEVGQTAIQQDMAGGGGVTAQCFHGSHH